MDKALVGVAVGVGYLAFLFFMIRWAVRRSRALLAARAAAFSDVLTAGGARLVRSVPGRSPYYSPEMELELPDGKRVFVQSWYVTRTQARLNIRVATPALPSIMLTREGALARFAKNIGLTREVQLNDPTFDSKVFIHSRETDDVVKNTLGGARVRAAIMRAVDSGFTVSLGERGLEAFVLTSAYGSPDAGMVPSIAGLLHDVAEDVPEGSGPVVVIPPPPRVSWVALAVIGALVGGGVAAGFVAAANPVATLNGEGSGAVLWGLCGGMSLVALLVAVVRGRSDAHRIVLAAGVVLLIGGTMMGTLMALVLNQALDDRTADETHVVEVLRVHHGSHDHDLHVQSWRGRAYESIDLRHSELRQFNAGDRVTVHVFPGAFGWKWARVTAEAGQPAP